MQNCSQVALRMGTCFSDVPVCALHGVRLRQVENSPADVLHCRAGEVVDQRIQCAVQIGQAEAEEKTVGQVFQGGTDVRLWMSSG